LKTAIDSLPG